MKFRVIKYHFASPPTPTPKKKYRQNTLDHLVAITSKGLITTATTNPERKAANKLFCQAGLPGPNISVTRVYVKSWAALPMLIRGMDAEAPCQRPETPPAL